MFMFWRSHPVVLRIYSKFYVHGSLLARLMNQMWCREWKLVEVHAFPLYSLFPVILILFSSEVYFFQTMVSFLMKSLISKKFKKKLILPSKNVAHKLVFSCQDILFSSENQGPANSDTHK